MDAENANIMVKLANRMQKIQLSSQSGIPVSLS